MRQGEVQHWRWLNAGDEQFLPMTVDGLDLFEIGFDGNPYDHARQTDQIMIAPGNRSNIMVRAPEVGVYELIRPAFTQGTADLPEARMAQVIVLPADTDRIPEGVKMGTRIPEGPLPKKCGFNRHHGCRDCKSPQDRAGRERHAGDVQRHRLYAEW